MIVTDGAGELASKSPNAVLAPASTEKLLTAVVALSTMGPDFKYETKAVAPAAPANGAVSRLWLVGAGDPGLATPEYQALIASDPETKDEVTTPLVSLADSIVAAGVRSIPGGVQGDDSRYDTMRYLPTWKDTYRTDGQVGPIGALTVNHGFSAFKPKPVPVDDPAVFAAGELTRPAHRPGRRGGWGTGSLERAGRRGERGVRAVATVPRRRRVVHQDQRQPGW